MLIIGTASRRRPVAPRLRHLAQTSRRGRCFRDLTHASPLPPSPPAPPVRYGEGYQQKDRAEEHDRRHVDGFVRDRFPSSSLRAFIVTRMSPVSPVTIRFTIPSARVPGPSPPPFDPGRAQGHSAHSMGWAAPMQKGRMAWKMSRRRRTGQGYLSQDRCPNRSGRIIHAGRPICPVFGTPGHRRRRPRIGGTRAVSERWS